MQNWPDLRERVLSGVVMLAALIAAVVLEPIGIWVLLWLCFLTMHWELAFMAGVPRVQQIQIALLASILGLAIIVWPGLVLWWFAFTVVLMALPLIIGGLSAGDNRALYLVYGVFFVLGASGLWAIFESMGIMGLMFLVIVVILSDVAGYFVGRKFGGPKFWPAVSPKKTWSGTIGGWVAAGVFGLIFAITFGAFFFIPLAIILAFGAQMGDIAESAVKRRFGVKDSSDLIPGHGGVLDRFDGMIGASVAFMIVAAFTSISVGF